MKNSSACVIFKENKSTFFAIILRQLEKWKIIKRYQTRKPWLFYRVESKLVLNIIKQLIKSLEKKNVIIVSDCPMHTDFFTAFSLKTFFQSIGIL